MLTNVIFWVHLFTSMDNYYLFALQNIYWTNSAASNCQLFSSCVSFLPKKVEIYFCIHIREWKPYLFEEKKFGDWIHQSGLREEKCTFDLNNSTDKTNLIHLNYLQQKILVLFMCKDIRDIEKTATNQINKK